MSVSISALATALCHEINPADLTALKQRVDATAWHQHEPQLLLLCERLLALGYARDALDVLKDAPASVAVVHLTAYALANTAAPLAARELLLAHLGPEPDMDTLCYLGRVEKDLARLATTPASTRTHWQAALDYYAQAFSISRDPYPGVNQASLELRCHGVDRASATAQEVIALCDSNPAQDHWHWATLGEAYLISGDLQRAHQAYTRSVSAADRQLVALGSMVRQAREVMQLRGYDAPQVSQLFQLPPVVVYSQPGPAPVLDQVRIGYVTLAGAAEIDFAEVLQQRDAQVHLVLPKDAPSVRAALADADLARRFDRLLASATSMMIANDGADDDDPAYLQFAREIAHGMAWIKAHELGTTVAPAGAAADPTGANAGQRRVLGMIFADIVGYSSLTETQLRRFHQQVLPQIVSTLQGGVQPLLQQSFGDAFYLVYEDVVAAAEASLALQNLFVRGLQADGQASPLCLRIAAHAGPLTAIHDPFTGKTNYTGRHTSRAARVEPVSGENQILITQQFAALLKLSASAERYEWVYAGERVLPKNYGTELLYALHRSLPASG